MESVRDHPRTAVRSCHGSGKTYNAAEIVLWFALSFPGSRVLTTAPTFRQVETLLWQEIRQAHAKARVPLGGRMLLTQLKIEDGWFAIGYSTDDPDSFQGHHADHLLVVFDEASGIDAAIWEAADGVLSGAHARILSIGNPTDPAGRFAEECKADGVSRVHISAFDTPNLAGLTVEDFRDGSWQEKAPPLFAGAMVTPAWVADKMRRWGEASPLWISRVLGEFPDASTNTLIPLAWIEAAQRRTLEPGEPHTLGVDVGRGHDETVIYERRGSVARLRYAKQTPDTMTAVGAVVQALRETWATHANVDVIGVGAGVVDRLVEQGRPVTGVNVGEKAHDSERFSNRRAEVFWGLRERFEFGEIDLDPDDDEILSQLCSITYDPNSRGQIVIQSKDAMDSSPDRADALALAFAVEAPALVAGTWGR